MNSRLGFFPHLITGLNIFCGFQALLYTMNQNYIPAAWLIILAGIFDVLDGKVARLIKSTSELGVELDSMADVVSFGIAPAILFYSVLTSSGKTHPILWLVPFAYLTAGIFRLVRFNMVSKKKKNLSSKENFMGLPIPAAAFAISSYIIFTQDYFGEFAYGDFFLILMVIVSILMVSTIEFRSFPRISFQSPSERIIMVLLFSSIIAIAILPRKMFFVITMYYIFYYPVKKLIRLVRYYFSSETKVEP